MPPKKINNIEKDITDLEEKIIEYKNEIDEINKKLTAAKKLLSDKKEEFKKLEMETELKMRAEMEKEIKMRAEMEKEIKMRAEMEARIRAEIEVKRQKDEEDQKKKEFENKIRLEIEEKMKKEEKTQTTSRCTDQNCPFHGSLSVRGRSFTGTVVSDRMSKSVTVQWERAVFLPKYERYERKWSKVKAHNPECLNVKMGDKVKIMECRPISKTKHFVVVEKPE